MRSVDFYTLKPGFERKKTAVNELFYHAVYILGSHFARRAEYA